MVDIRIAVAQLNPIVGDLDGNVDKIVAAIAAAEADECDLVVFPEMVVTGCPPEDLLLKPSFVSDNLSALDRVASATGDTVAVVGFVDRENNGIDDGDGSGSADRPCGSTLYSAAAVCVRGRIVDVVRKRRLANHSVFDERRYFTADTEPHRLHEIAGVKVGIVICEDPREPAGSVDEIVVGGAEMIVGLTASPYHRGVAAFRETKLVERAIEADVPVIYVNMVGGQDELVFDGASVVVAADGTPIARSPQYAESTTVTDLSIEPRVDTATQDPFPVVSVTPRGAASRELSRGLSPPVITSVLDPLAEVYGALVLATHDYVTKNGFTDVVLGLSAGIDSSLVAAIAVDALGPQHVHGVLMPSRYSSEGSITGSQLLATNLGIDHRTIPIEPAHAAFLEILDPLFTDRAPDLTEENLQPRIRGMLLMALSNKFGWLVLTTGNKSEASVGYSTLYGDTAGGFAVIKDVPKTLVYELSRHRNATAGHDLIPESILTKPPSAELRPGQRDDQSLPPYDVLDPILEQYVELDRTAADLIDDGHDPELVRRIVRMVDLAEYKRRQTPLGPKITTKAFGRDRRLPITNHYR